MARSESARGRVRAAAAVLIALAVSPAGGPAASATSGTADSNSDSAVTEQLGAQRGSSGVAAWLDSDGALRADAPVRRFDEAVGTADSPVTATAMLIESFWGVRMPAADPAAPSVLRNAFPVGDLDRRQGGDVVVVESSFTSLLDVPRTGLNAVNGGDGAALWSRPLGAPLAAPPLGTPDLTGDGAADLLVLTFGTDRVSVSWCGSTQCTYAHVQQHTWTLQALSGADGSPVWTRRIDGQLAWGGAGAALFPPGVITSDSLTVVTAALVLPLLSDDHNGDGAPDLALNVVDLARPFDYQWTSHARAGSSTPAFATRARLLSGRSGQVLLERSQPLALGGEAVLTPAGNALGSGVGDLLWQSEVTATTTSACYSQLGDGCLAQPVTRLDLEMIDGETFSTGWRRTMSSGSLTEAFARPAGADLTGDGNSELVLWSAADFDGDRAWSMAALSGIDGTPLWRRDQQAYPDPVDGTVIGAVTGGSGADLLVLDLELRVGLQEFDSFVRRVDGATGATVLSTHRSSRYLTVDPAGDSDLDGVADLVVNTGWWRPGQTPALSWVGELESGATGTMLLVREVRSTQVRLLRPGGDLDGDSRADLTDLVVSLRADEPSTIAAVSSASRRTLWGQAYPYSPLVVTQGGSLYGDRDGVLATRTGYADQRYRSQVEALDPVRQEVAWTLGDELGPKADYPLVASHLAVTPGSQTSAQHTDEAVMEVRLRNAYGDPVSGAAVRFRLGDQVAPATTGGTGVARVTLPVAVPPGTETLHVWFAGTPYHLAGSTVSTGFTVHREDSALTLAIVDEPGGRSLRFRLTDGDSASTGLADRPVACLADGQLVGSATTDTSGSAMCPIPPRFQRGAHAYQVRFAGDERFLASAAVVNSDGT